MGFTEVGMLPNDGTHIVEPDSPLFNLSLTKNSKLNIITVQNQDSDKLISRLRIYFYFPGVIYFIRIMDDFGNNCEIIQPKEVTFYYASNNITISPSNKISAPFSYTEGYSRLTLKCDYLTYGDLIRIYVVTDEKGNTKTFDNVPMGYYAFYWWQGFNLEHITKIDGCLNSTAGQCINKKYIFY